MVARRFGSWATFALLSSIALFCSACGDDSCDEVAAQLRECCEQGPAELRKDCEKEAAALEEDGNTEACDGMLARGALEGCEK